MEWIRGWWSSFWTLEPTNEDTAQSPSAEERGGVEPTSSSKQKEKCFSDEIDTDFMCPICFDIFYKPVVTPCGHLFCCSCLEECMEIRKRCPYCRHAVEFYIPVPQLAQALEKSFPEAMSERVKKPPRFPNRPPSANSYRRKALMFLVKSLCVLIAFSFTLSYLKSRFISRTLAYSLEHKRWIDPNGNLLF